MSEEVQTNNQQVLIIGLVVIAALLAAIVGVIVYQQSTAAKIPAMSSTPAATQPAQDAAAPGAMPAATDTAFDSKTATKVTGGAEPEGWVKAYYEACDKDDWEGAFSHLPTAKQAGNSPDALKEQVTGYGIKGWKVTSAKVEGDKATVIVDQETGQYGTFENTWTFVKEGDEWLVESKAVTGMK